MFCRLGYCNLPTFQVCTDVAGGHRLQQQRARENTGKQYQAHGYVDSAVNPTFAFGKLYRADECILHVNEIELWNVAQVYEFDEMHVLYGEATTKTIVPPDYVTLQSNMLFARKTDVKNLIKHYTEGVPYAGDIPSRYPRESHVTLGWVR